MDNIKQIHFDGFGNTYVQNLDYDYIKTVFFLENIGTGIINRHLIL